MRKTGGAIVSGWFGLVLPALLPVTAVAEPLLLDTAPESTTSSTVTVPSPIPPQNNPVQEVLADNPAPANPLAPNAPVADPAGAAAPVVNAPAVNALLANTQPAGTILILPFQPNNPADPNAWVGKSIQESLVADVTVFSPERVKSADQAPANPDAAIALGRQQGARYVVAGGFATVNRELRITGQILDVESGKAVGAIKVTGDPSQLFRMEDGLAMQLRAQLMPGQQPPAPQPQLQPQPDQQRQPPGLIWKEPPAVDANGVRTDYGSPPISSPYAVAPVPNIYGAVPYDPSVDGTYANPPYNYPAYSYYPYCDDGYGYYPYCGLGLGCNYGGYYGYHYGRNNAFRGNGGFRGSGGFSNGRSSFSSVRSPSVIRGSGFSASVHTTVPFRSSASYGHTSVGRSSSIGVRSSGSMHSFGGGGSFHGGGSSHGGGGGHGGGHR